MSIITKEHRDFFKENGYVKIEQLLPKENCDRVIAAIWEFLGMSPTDAESWYNPPSRVLSSAGMVELYHHQSLWDNRQHPRVYQAFAELLGQEKLWVSIDRVNMTPPKRADHPELDYSFIHWDTDTANLPSPLPHPYGVQGVLYLADTTEKQGGFQCVSSIYRNIEEWIKNQPSDRNPRIPNLDGDQVQPIPGKAGDLVIWDRLLPHGNGHNNTDKPRFAQYITMSPAAPEKLEARQKYIECWKNIQSPPGDPFPGDPRKWEQKHYSQPPELTPLGRKLLGLDPWDA